MLTENLADEAFDLLVQASDWDSAERVLLDQARNLLRRGRWRTVETWVRSLPAQRLQDSPWARYWLGRSKALIDPVAANSIFESANRSFSSIEDHHGELPCAAAIVDALYFAVDRFDEMPVWLGKLNDAIIANTSALSSDDELQVHATLFWAAETSDPCSPRIAPSVAKIEQLLPLCSDANLRISAANMLHYYAVHTLYAQATQVAAREAHPYLDSSDLSADRLALYWLAEGTAHFNFARFQSALDCYDRADAIIDAHGLSDRVYLAGVWRAPCQHIAGDVAGARRTLERIEKLNVTSPPVITQVLYNASAWVALEHGKYARALESIRAARASCEKHGMLISLGWWLPNEAYLSIAAGDTGSAREPIATAQRYVKVFEQGRFLATLALMEAWEALRLGQRSRSEDRLRNALLLPRNDGERIRLRWFRLALSDLLLIAIERQIEVEIAQTMIREFALAPPESAPEAWPWPIKIYTLGRFEVLINDRPLEFGRKVPRRTLALLKAIIALGGAEVSEQRLIDALWPDLDGDAASESLAAALHRLRRLLGSNDAILQSGGTLSVNRQCCFVDAISFEGNTGHSKIPSTALQLYRGNFLHGDDAAPWAASMRERLRGKFIRLVDAMGKDHEGIGQHEEAIAIYSRGIDTDDLVEPFYRGLMRCHEKLGRRAEAASAFRRLRQALSVTLGLKPSVESQRLFEELRLQ